MRTGNWIVEAMEMVIWTERAEDQMAINPKTRDNEQRKRERERDCDLIGRERK